MRKNSKFTRPAKHKVRSGEIQNSKLKTKTACIIPSYNEGERVIKVLEEICRVKNLSEIICVDDGSNNNSKFKISHFASGFARGYVGDRQKSRVILKTIFKKKNEGKSAAILKGLKKTNCKYILLADGDIQNLQALEIEKAVTKIQSRQNVDMIILKRVNAKLESRWIRADTIFSGERILRRSELLKIFATLRPQGYQIEIAINKYMMDHQKKVYWMKSSAVNVFKRDKIGSVIQGTIKEHLMHFQMMRYAGFTTYLKQILFFCKKEIF